MRIKQPVEASCMAASCSGNVPQDSTVCCVTQLRITTAPMRAPAPGYAPAGSSWAGGCSSANSNVPIRVLPTHTAGLTVDRQPASLGAG